ncbi:chemotaxis protein CheA [Dactylosporangium siamense]|uniref:Chemotaxis protein CheA n=1 Tax=Dactylosporangium siamense TaxID=685454 RepID=A0A919PRZ5_9ACTN|nr:chemotaxis protein CheA [Dactylosporangium siamense]GIG49800.1 chemotaxis protein CheA [Dactylosporangium siamense]
MTDDDLADALDTFITEARELLQDFEEGLLGLEDEPSAQDSVNALFRTMHTLKGSAGLFGLHHLVAFTHVVETVLDSVREGELAVSAELVSALLPCGDHVSSMVEGVAAGRLDATTSETVDGDRLLAALQPFLTLSSPLAPVLAEPEVDTLRTWRLTLRFGPDSLRNGMDPLSFLRYLATMGVLERVTTLTDALPDAEQMDPETCYLGFVIDFVSGAAKADIEDVFDFVREDSQISIVPADGQADDYVKVIEGLPDQDRLGDLLVRSGAVTDLEIARALQIQQERNRTGDSLPPLGEILIETQTVPKPVVDAALGKQRKTADSRSQETQTIRVYANRLDKLIDLVGELVIAQSSVGIHRPDEEGYDEAQGEVMRLVEEVRHSALSLRMVPIGTTLRRFERVVRDVCVDLDKDVDLVITGGEAEMDKALVERIGDPLLHLVRNALDHGVEPRADRERQGKPIRGKLRLNAFHDAGSIVIEVADDGRGLNRDRILGKAVERGMVQPGTVMSDHEVYDLIFEPGFSTVETVSNLSGRGVGMDVVRRNIAELRGTIEVLTTAGAGTTFRIRLPLTLAIIDGFLVGVGPSAFIVPLDRVTECVELPPNAAERDCMYLRGEVLPFIRLRTIFDIAGTPPRRQNVVVIEQSGQRAGLVVDTLLGQFQTVIKPLGVLFSEARCISGSTILGNGEVALILDVGPLVAENVSREQVLV